MFRRDMLKAGAAGIGTLALSKTAGAAGSFFKASEEKTWAVVYGSKCGSTKQIAEWINKGLGEIADVVDVTTDPSVDDYEFLIIGGWISGGNLIKDVENFVTDNKDALKDKIAGLFTVCGNGGNPVGNSQIQSLLTEQIVKFSGVSDKPAKLFNGKSDPACNGLTFEYDLLDEGISVEFGESILSTAIKSMQKGHPKRFELLPTVPGRFSPVTTISYNLPLESNVLLTICGLNGRELATLVSSRQQAGHYSIKWDTGRFAPGYYLVRLHSGHFSATRKTRVLR
jgi:flavodoxin